MTRLLLIRHGSVDALGHHLAGQAAGIHLNEQGREEANGIVRRLQRVQITAIYSSPLERALETAAPLAGIRRLAVRKRTSLIDTDFGRWTGMRFAELEQLSGWRDFNSKRATARAPGGESLMNVMVRTLGALSMIARLHSGTVAIFSHCDPIRAVLAYRAGCPLEFIENMVVNPASIHVLEVRALNPSGPVWSIDSIDSLASSDGCVDAAALRTEP